MKNIIKYSYLFLSKLVSAIISTIILLVVGSLYIVKYFTKEPEKISTLNSKINYLTNLSKDMFKSKNSNDVIDSL